MHSIYISIHSSQGFEWDGSVGFLKSHVCEEGLFLICVRPPVVNRVGRDGGGGALICHRPLQ